MSADRLTLHGATMEWDAGARLFRASYEPNARPRGDDAPTMQRWMDERAGHDAPFDMIVDLEHADKVAIAWRYRWMSWFYAHRKRLRVAIHHADALGPTVVNAFAMSTRTEIRAFDGEPAALAWLRQQDALRPRPESI